MEEFVIGRVRVGDLLASKLDEEQGAEIRDQQIFRSHAAFYEQEYHEVKIYRGRDGGRGEGEALGRWKRGEEAVEEVGRRGEAG